MTNAKERKLLKLLRTTRAEVAIDPRIEARFSDTAMPQELLSPLASIRGGEHILSSYRRRHLNLLWRFNPFEPFDRHLHQTDTKSTKKKQTKKNPRYRAIPIGPHC